MQGLKYPQIHFLIYLNRSGSTLLAQKLNYFKEIAVSLEARLIDGIKRGPLIINTENDLEQYLNLIFQDEKISSWRMDLTSLKSRIRKNTYPIKFNTILKEILNEYFCNSSKKIYIYKCGRYFLYIDKIKSLFPNSKFIFISRDPRAIYNSQVQSKDSITKKPMAKDIVRFAIGYKNTYKIVNDVQHKKYLHIVNYESLVTNEQKELKKILTFLHVQNIKSKQQDYFDSIPNNQKHLHYNLKSEKYLSDRINGWQHELNKSDIVFLQKTLKSELTSNGYDLVFLSSLSISESIVFVINRLRYFWLYNIKIFFKKYYEVFKIYLSQ